MIRAAEYIMETCKAEKLQDNTALGAGNSKKLDKLSNVQLRLLSSRDNDQHVRRNTLVHRKHKCTVHDGKIGFLRKKRLYQVEYNISVTFYISFQILLQKTVFWKYKFILNVITKKLCKTKKSAKIYILRYINKHMHFLVREEKVHNGKVFCFKVCLSVIEACGDVEWKVYSKGIQLSLC